MPMHLETPHFCWIGRTPYRSHLRHPDSTCSSAAPSTILTTSSASTAASPLRKGFREGHDGHPSTTSDAGSITEAFAGVHERVLSPFPSLICFSIILAGCVEVFSVEIYTDSGYTSGKVLDRCSLLSGRPHASRPGDDLTNLTYIVVVPTVFPTK